MTDPRSQILPADSGLSLTPDLKDSDERKRIIQNLKDDMRIRGFLTINDVKLKALKEDRRVFPSDGLLIHLAVESYEDNPREEIGEWKLLTVAKNNAITNRYFGVAYWNGAERQVVIAHRGTPFDFKWDLWGAVWNDVQGVWRNKIDAPQLRSAITFTNLIKDVINELNKEPGIYVQLSITGHSLGGWLAQLTTLSVKYLAPYTDGNAYYFQTNLNPNTGHHAHTVAFDSPGCQELLTEMQPKLFNTQGSECSLDDLDVTVYLSAPNVVNTKNLHIKRKVYRIFIDLSEYKPSRSWFSTAWFTYHLSFTHDKLRIQELFKSRQIRKDEVSDWPQFRVNNPEEYQKIFSTADESNNFVPRPNVTWAGHRDIRYSTRPVDPKVFKMSYLSQQERILLYGCQLRFRFNALEALNGNHGSTVRDCLHNEWDRSGVTIKNNHLHCEDHDRLFKLVSLIRRYCHFYPAKSAKPFDSGDIMMNSFQMESDEYLTAIKKCELYFVKNAKLDQFLQLNNNNNEISCNKFHWVEEKTFVGALRIYRAIENTRLRGNCLFLNFNQLQMLSKHINLKELLRNNPHLMLAIECQSECHSEEVENIWNDFPPATNKLVLITDQRFHFDNLPDSNTNTDDKGIRFHRLTDETKEKIKDKLISLQNQKFQLRHIGVAENLSTATLISLGFDETLIIGKELKECDICYIGRTLRVCTINPDIICSRNNNDAEIIDIFVKSSVGNNNCPPNFEQSKIYMHGHTEVKLNAVTVQQIDNTVNFVVGKAGTGKSTIFDHLALKIKRSYPTLWVVTLTASQMAQYHDVSHNDIADTLITAFHITSELEIDFLKLYTSHSKVVLFVDGLDQVSQHKDRVESLVKHLLEQRGKFHQIWFSCRRESTYKQMTQGHTDTSIAYTLQPFTPTEQRQCLSKLWSRNMNDADDRFHEYFDELTKSFQLICGKYEDFTGNPRILLLIGEYIESHFHHLHITDKPNYDTKYHLWHSYRDVIEKYLKESVVEEGVLKRFLKKCQLIAVGSMFRTELQYLLSADELDEWNELQRDGDSGLDQLWIFHEMLDGPMNQVSCFIHGSFDEYFAAQYLIDHINDRADSPNIQSGETTRAGVNNPCGRPIDELKNKYDNAVRKVERECAQLKREYIFNWFLTTENKIICDLFERQLIEKEFGNKLEVYKNQFGDKVSPDKLFVMTKLAHCYDIPK